MNTRQPTYNQPCQNDMGGHVSPRLQRRRTLFAQWEQRLMRGTPAIGNTLPAWFSNNAIVAYVVALLLVAGLWFGYSMEWYFWLFGLAWVVGFFSLAQRFSNVWSIRIMHSQKRFERALFWSAFLIRAVYVMFMYFFYREMTGVPFEFSAADSMGYTGLAQDWAQCFEENRLWDELVKTAQRGVSDMGFPVFMFPFFYVFDAASGIIAFRLVNALLGAYMALLVYRLTHRSMGETTARFAAIFVALHPVLICYAGMSLKEVLMTTILTLFIDKADQLLRNKRYSFGTIAPVVLIGLSLFLFRTVLGMVAFMAVLFTLVTINSKVISTGRKIAIGIVMGGMMLFAISDNIMNEVRELSETDTLAQQRVSMEKRYGAGKKGGGNAFAQYAGAAVFAPLIFTIPFPTMVATADQEDMRLIHGGNWVRNVMSGFIILAMIMLLLSGDWRQYTLPLAMMLGYLVMLVFTEFAHSLRFHIPIIPFEMMFAAYAIANMRRKHKRWYLYWCIFMIVTCVGWNWFKLAGRGLA